MGALMSVDDIKVRGEESIRLGDHRVQQ
jgi:hypothetical protein